MSSTYHQFNNEFLLPQDAEVFSDYSSLSSQGIVDYNYPILSTPSIINYNLVPHFDQYGNDIDVPASDPFALGLQDVALLAPVLMPSFPLRSAWPGSTSFMGDPSMSPMFNQQRRHPLFPYPLNEVVGDVMDVDFANTKLFMPPETFNVGEEIVSRSAREVPVDVSDVLVGNREPQGFGVGDADRQEDALSYLTPEPLDSLHSMLYVSEVPQESTAFDAYIGGADMCVVEEEFPDFMEWHRIHYPADAGCGGGCADHGGHHEDMAVNDDEVEDKDEDNVDQSPTSPPHAQMQSGRTIQTRSMKLCGQDSVHLGSGNDLPRHGSSFQQSKKQLLGKARQLSALPKSTVSASCRTAAQRRARANGHSAASAAMQRHQREVAEQGGRILLVDEDSLEARWEWWRIAHEEGPLRKLIKKYKLRWRCPECNHAVNRDNSFVRHCKTLPKCAASEKVQWKRTEKGELVVDEQGRKVVDHWQHIEGDAPWLVKDGTLQKTRV